MKNPMAIAKHTPWFAAAQIILEKRIYKHEKRETRQLGDQSFL